MWNRPTALGILGAAFVAALLSPPVVLAAGAQRATVTKLAPAKSSHPKIFFQKGVNFTAEFPAVYGSDAAERMLERLPRFGINAVALVPYGFAERNPPRVRGWNTRWESDEGVARLAARAHQLGMKVFLKPQLWLGRALPSDLDFSSAEDRAAWFAQYQIFLEHYARLATRIHADIFSVGVELSQLTKYEADWRRMIARVRQLYPGPIVYAANFGREFESIRFWDALDYIGLNNYYPLPDDLSTDEVVRKVEAIERRFNRPVIFTEAGFPSMEAPQRAPWDERPRKLAPDEQARCYEAVFRAFYKRPWFQGVYWWKLGTNGFGGRLDGSHSPWRKPAMQVVREWYLHGGR